ncbi:MAG TPA: ferrous iron transport protein B [Bacteroidales bacterium]|nr:ferrous iron transport protein B [Bacteroidales bacterium]
MSKGARLSEIHTGNSVFIENVKGNGTFRQRIGEMGFVKGKKITVIKNAPLNDPIEFSLMGYNVSLRRSEASLIEVSPGSGPEVSDEPVYTENITDGPAPGQSGHIIKVAVVGNPNSGKTTIFNFASGSRERVGNYTGVTIDAKTATFRLGKYVIQLTDLPGTYSLSAFSPEELFVRDFILLHRPDVVINIVDATSLERNLFLTTQLIDMNTKVVIALNMYDELLINRDRFDYAALGRMLGIPFVPTIGARGKGIRRLFQKVIDVHCGKDPYQRDVRLNYGFEVEKSISKIQDKSRQVTGQEFIDGIPARFIALRLLNKDRHVEHLIVNVPRRQEILSTARNEVTRIEHLMGDTTESVITDSRYGFIAGALRETFRPGPSDRRKTSNRIDHLLTNRYLGFPVFLFFLWLMFTFTFTLGIYPQNWIENGVSLLGNMLNNNMADGSLKQLLIEGIIGGVGGVIVFLPNILILFFFISVMEDTGYMARAAFIMDKLMHKIGLHGKSFIPLVMGFGCNVPAIMATRTIENRSNRLLTMLINPFMSCSARLPVYILLIGAVFPDYKGTMLFGIYLTGIVVAILVALIFKNTFFRTSDAPFVMELPPYRIPTVRSTVKHMWYKASQYLKKMGGVILVASVLIWALGHYPVRINYSTDYEKEKAIVTRSFDKRITESSGDRLLVSGLQEERSQELKKIDFRMRSEHQEKSYIGLIGQFIEPAIRPLGFDWRMGVCLLTGVAAKEIVVSTMGVIYQAEDAGNNSYSLQERIRSATHAAGINQGKNVYTPLATVAFILFTLLYFPCVATIAAILKESGSWKWALFSVFYTTGLAWVLSFIVYNVGRFIIS